MLNTRTICHGNMGFDNLRKELQEEILEWVNKNVTPVEYPENPFSTEDMMAIFYFTKGLKISEDIMNCGMIKSGFSHKIRNGKCIFNTQVI